MTLMLDDNFRPTRGLAVLLATYAAIQAAGIAFGIVAGTVQTVRALLAAPIRRNAPRQLRTA